MFMSVLLPEPLAPTIATSSPGAIVKSTSVSARTISGPLRYSLPIPSRSTRGVDGSSMMPAATIRASLSENAQELFRALRVALLGHDVGAWRYAALHFREAPVRNSDV